MLARCALTALLIGVVAVPSGAQEEKQPPYWASIASGQAMTRTGPGRNYPGVWLYQRRDLPVRVLKKYQTWRLVQDPDGAQGWMLVTLLSDRRTAVVRPGQPRPVRTDRSPDSPARFMAEPGVIGRIDKCREGACRITIGKHQGYMSEVDLWGVSDGEVID